ncbi:hypothetical protein [Wenxinia marina]|uniref:N-(5'-phosphoribosyl)anthranilate isomerase n=1 Tax=Wenxinia marina DSM 24838 TaxID=1123501 RepID=A0A0D0PBP2_9RHOB|nr:hypothetical protein [Wenxinia marina]KIQ68871.1 hypothetical protein Wenmar_02600 [Wenxinia marina DSM 24838]GGL64533.1 hypothetical protein GCM10011392_19010 [Wenxinia marina]
MSASFALPTGRDWLDQVFACRAATTGGVIRRQVVDVVREVGEATFVAEVRRRGFRLIRTQGHFIVVCGDGAIEIVI